MALGALRPVRHAMPAVLVVVLALVLAGIAHSLAARPVSAGPATPPDLAVTISASAEPVAANQKFSYTITVTNIGGSTAGTELDVYGYPVGVSVLNNLPQGFVVNSFSASGNPPCQLTPPNPLAATLTCQYGPLAAGQVETVVVSGSIPPGGHPKVSSIALVDLPISRTAESSETSNNAALASTNVLQPTATPTMTATVTPTVTPTRTSVPPSLGGVAQYPPSRGGRHDVLFFAAFAALALAGAIVARCALAPQRRS